jgi:hypothetical protein
MNLRRAFLALGAMILGVGFFGAFPQQAQAQTVTCAPVNSSPSQWPLASNVQECTGSATPVYGGIVRNTLESIGNDGTDAAQRLKFTITASEAITVQVVDSSLTGGSSTATHTTVSTDSAYTIAADLANQIAQLPNFVAYANGNVLYIYSFTGNTTTYVMGTSVGAHETITSTPDGLGNATGTIEGSPNTFTWYDFANRQDYDSTTAIGSSDKLPPLDLMNPDTFPGANGVTYVSEIATQKSSSIFEVSGYAINNEVIANTTAHETGHVLDHVYGKVFGVSPDSNSNIFYSNSVAFQNAFMLDRFYMDLVPVCSFQASNGQNVDDDGNPTGGPYASVGPDGISPGSDGGVPGSMSSVEEPSTSGYICGGTYGDGRNAPYEPTTVAIDTIFSTLRLDDTAEVFAEWFAVQEGFSDQIDNSNSIIHGKDGVLNQSATGNYICTGLYVQTLRTEGREPSSYELSVTGYLVPDGPLAGGPDAGMYGYGFTFYACDGATTEHFIYNFGS